MNATRLQRDGVSTSGLLPLKMGVVLYPFKGATAPNVAARRLRVSSGEAVVLEVKAQTASDYIVVSRRPGGECLFLR